MILPRSSVDTCLALTKLLFLHAGMRAGCGSMWHALLRIIWRQVPCAPRDHPACHDCQQWSRNHTVSGGHFEFVIGIRRHSAVLCNQKSRYRPLSQRHYTHWCLWRGLDSLSLCIACVIRWAVASSVLYCFSCMVYCYTTTLNAKRTYARKPLTTAHIQRTRGALGAVLHC